MCNYNISNISFNYGNNIKKIKIRFDNGLILSIVAGSLVHSDIIDFRHFKNVEIAVFYQNEFVTKKIFNSSDNVIGYVYMDELVEYMNKLKNYDIKNIKGENK